MYFKNTQNYTTTSVTDFSLTVVVESTDFVSDTTVTLSSDTRGGAAGVAILLSLLVVLLAVLCPLICVVVIVVVVVVGGIVVVEGFGASIELNLPENLTK